MRLDCSWHLALTSGATTAIVALIIVGRHPETNDSPAWAVAVSLAAALSMIVSSAAGPRLPKLGREASDAFVTRARATAAPSPQRAH